MVRIHKFWSGAYCRTFKCLSHLYYHVYSVRSLGMWISATVFRDRIIWCLGGGHIFWDVVGNSSYTLTLGEGTWCCHHVRWASFCVTWFTCVWPICPSRHVLTLKLLMNSKILDLLNQWWSLGHWHLGCRSKCVSFHCMLVLLQDHVVETFRFGYYQLSGAESWFALLVVLSAITQ